MSHGVCSTHARVCPGLEHVGFECGEVADDENVHPHYRPCVELGTMPLLRHPIAIVAHACTESAEAVAKHAYGTVCEGECK